MPKTTTKFKKCYNCNIYIIHRQTSPSYLVHSKPQTSNNSSNSSIMLLQPTTSKPPIHQTTQTHHKNPIFITYSSPFCSLGNKNPIFVTNSSPFCTSGNKNPIFITNSSPFSSLDHKNETLFTCSAVSKVHSYGTMDYENRPMLKWSEIYKKVSMMENPELGPASVLNQCENEGKRLTKWELSRVVKELRKFRKFKLALEVYEWMINRPERFRMTTSDTAIQLDLISKVKGISVAEEYFRKLSDGLKDNRIYGSLLNAYVSAKMKEKAESLIGIMKSKGYTNHSLPFNVMMTLYMNLRDYDKVDSVVSEMMEKRISLDIYTYNIWISSCGSRGSLEKMEQAYEQMKMDTSINPNWTTFSTMASMYIKLEEPQKAEDCLKKLESRLTGRDRIPYHYLISLYGSVGNKDEVLRVWNIYKSLFQNIPNLGFHAVISSLVRMGDIEVAEEIYESWMSVRSAYDPRIANLLLGWYVREGLADKAEAFFNQLIEVGGKPNSMTWEILAEGHIRDRKIAEALSCLKNATETIGSKSWKPKPVNVSSLLKICEQEADTSSKEELMEILKKMGCLENEQYMSYIPLSDQPSTSNGSAMENSNFDEDEVAAEVLLGQVRGSL